MTLGENIRYYRKTNKLSQEKIGELVGVSRQAVTRWETNQSAPSTENLIKLSSIFNISLEELISINHESINEIPKGKNKRVIRKILIAWGVILIVQVLALVFIRSSFKWYNLIWTLINLTLLLGYLAVGIYIVVLLIRALNKYLQS
jgi:transcriptional regulator with XRE-family HTH domain